MWVRAQRAAGSDFARKVAETFGTRIVVTVVGAVVSIVVARVLGPQGRGMFSVTMAISAIGVQFGTLGLQSSNTYLVARDRSLLPALLGNSLLVSLLFGSAAALVCWLAVWLQPQWGPGDSGLLLLGLACVPVSLLFMLLQGLLLGIQQVRDHNKVELARGLFSAAAVGLAIVAFWRTPLGVLAATTAALLAGTLLSWWNVRRHVGARPKVSLQLFRDAFRYGIKVYAACLFMFFVLRFDLVMVNAMLGPKHAGWYSVTAMLADQLYVFPAVVGSILFPKLATIDSDALKLRHAGKTALVLGLIVGALAGLLMATARPLIGLLYGEAYLPGAGALQWLLPGIVMLSINTVLMNYFAALGFPRIAIFSPLAALFVNVALNLLLIPRLGIVGAALASTVSYGMMLLASVVYIALGPPRRSEANHAA